MTAVADAKTAGVPFGNAEDMVRVVYDFSEDAGAEGALNLLTADGDIVITDFYVKGVTVLDSATDTATIDVGIVGGLTDRLLDNQAEAIFIADTLIQGNGAISGSSTGDINAMPMLLEDDGVIAMTIKGEALTSGKCEFYFKYHKFGK